MDRPRRNVQSKSYADYTSSDSEGDDSEEQTFELRASSPDEHKPVIEESGMQMAEPLTSSQTRELIDVHTTQLDVIDTEVAELQERLSILHQQRSRIVQDLFEGRARVSVMHKVSQDVLSMVSMYYVVECKQSPWTLMHVNRKWRQTALETRSIWTGLELTSILWQKGGYSRIRDGRELCATEQQLGRALARAGNSCLDVRIFADRPGQQKKWGRREISSFENVIQAFSQLLGANLRLASLKVEGRNTSRIRSLSLKGITFPHLQGFLLSDYNDDLVRYVSSSALSLESLELRYFSAKALDVTFPWWSGLRSLKLNSHCREEWGVSRYTLLTRILSKTTSLQHLEIDGIYSYPANPTFQFPQLLTLSTSAYIGPMQVKAPLLTRLKLRPQVVHQTESADIVEQNFPSLTHLEVECATRRLQYIVAPSLHTLIIKNSSRRSDNDQAAERVWLNPDRQHFLNPVVLHIIKISIHLHTLWRLLTVMDRLEELFIAGVPLKRSFFTELFHHRIAVPEKPDKWAAPSLKRLKLDFSECKHVEDIQTLRAAGMHAHRARQKFGLPLDSIQVKVSYGGQWLTLDG